MLDLSERTEALARCLAETQKLSVDDAVRHALERQARTAGLNNGADAGSVSEEEVARRLALIREVQQKLAALPVLDPRSPEKIMDELNEL